MRLHDSLKGWFVEGALAMLACLATAAPASGQQLDLSVNPANVSFGSADPDTTPIVVAPPTVVTIRVRGLSGGGTWRLTVLADGDLIAGPAAVDISNVTWTATPSPPFQNGTLSRTVPQTMAAGTGNVPQPLSGSVVFRLVNSWNHAAGVYTQTFVLTLSAP